jgi:hypothetical protein
VFTTSEDNNGTNKKKNKKKNHSANNKGSQLKQVANRSSDSDEESNKNQFQCFGCGSCDHALQNCPVFKAFKKTQQSSVMTTTSRGSSRRNVCFSDADDEDEDFHLLCMTREVPCPDFQISDYPPATTLENNSVLFREVPRGPVVLDSSGVKQDSVQLDSFSTLEDNSVLPRGVLPRDPEVNGSHRVKPESTPLDRFIGDNSVLLRQSAPRDPVVSAFSRVEPDMCVLLDSQANLSIFREPLLLNSIRQSPSIKRIGGISSENMVVNQIGDHPDFGIIYFNPHATANVLCQYDMAIKMGYKIELNEKAHSYTMSGTKTGSVYVFEETNKLAMCACLPTSELLRSTNESPTILQVAIKDDISVKGSSERNRRYLQSNLNRVGYGAKPSNLSFKKNRKKCKKEFSISTSTNASKIFKKSEVKGNIGGVHLNNTVDIKLDDFSKCSTGTKELDLVLKIKEVLQVLRSRFVDVSLGVHSGNKERTELVATLVELLPQLIDG